MPRNKTHCEFMLELKTKQFELFNSIEIIDKYVAAKIPLLIKTKYGLCKNLPHKLLFGHFPSIKTALNKTEYFKNALQYNHPELLEQIKIIGKYKKIKTPIKIETRYGECLITPDNLLRGHFPTIQTAINKNEYFINQAKEIHGDLYDYSCVKYKNAKTKIEIISEYGSFWQTPDKHLRGNGCPILGFNSSYHYISYVEKGLRNKKSTSFKVYIIKCWNDNEMFYKIGKTYQTIKQRYGRKVNIPYNYKIVKELKFDKTLEGGLKCCKTERDLQNQFKNYKYVPKIPFGGMYECFEDIFQVNLKA